MYFFLAVNAFAQCFVSVGPLHFDTCLHGNEGHSDRI